MEETRGYLLNDRIPPSITWPREPKWRKVCVELDLSVLTSLTGRDRGTFERVKKKSIKNVHTISLFRLEVSLFSRRFKSTKMLMVNNDPCTKHARKAYVSAR